MIKGIDVSAYQSSDYATSGYDFVIVKATEGRTYINPKQSRQAARARTAGLVLGFYHFLWPGNIRAQARYFVEQCASLPGDILACDWEHTSSGTAASSAEKDEFLREVKRLRPDHKVLLYCNVDFWINRDRSSYAGDGLWIAQYNGRPGDPSIRAQWLIHQYTSTPLDINVADFPSRAAMRAWADGDSTPHEEDDLPYNRDELCAAVLTNDGVLRSMGDNPDNPHWTAETYLRNTLGTLREVRDAVDGLEAVELTDAQVAQLADGLAAHPALADRIAEKVADKLAARLAE